MNIDRIKKAISDKRAANARRENSLETDLILSLAEKQLEHLEGGEPNNLIVVSPTKQKGETFLDLVLAGAIGGASVLFVITIIMRVLYP